MTHDPIIALRMNTAFYVIAGISDLFITLMLWLILDDAKVTDLLVDGDRVYSVEI